MCYSLHIHVLCFFRFFKGSQGKLYSFSCTIATNKKFKDALSKHKTDGCECDLGQSKELEESEVLALSSIGQISSNVPLKSNGDDSLLEVEEIYPSINELLIA
ncbi:hypothetical protein L2E82_16756 [Cichorium intybus]|uniref:Uncharacterized protein n=1 Tax=Cichorium intybus TaxID=13427 RepID=A0ACB9F6E4_CICIN|nr:hypothetical protein L2E82_16756 [Cichorium intybus]